MEIKPTYVSLEQAKLFKEKGFNEECRAWYCEHKKIQTDVETFKLWCALQAHKFNTVTNANVQFAFNKDCFAAPEQWQVVEWLFQKHKIYIHTSIIGDEDTLIDSNCDWGVCIYKDKMYNLLWGSKITPNVDYYKSKTEAVSAAVDYILKELI